jgi:outer membrane lipoprotein-sorting protein
MSLSHKNICKLFFSFFAFIFTASLFSQNLTTKEIVEKMLVSDKNIQSLEFTQKAWEKLRDRIMYSEVKIKVCSKPYMFYCYNLAPSNGLEILYNSVTNPEEALVKPNGFPWVNLNLDPQGSLMRKDQHHSVFSAGFAFPITILKNGYERAKANGFEKVFTQLKDTLWNNQWCYIIQINSIDYKAIEYTVNGNENLIGIAKNNFINEYSILLLNPEISDYDDVKAGQKIKFPNAYAKKTIVFIDKKTFLPIVQIMYDEMGLFEKYEYHSLKINFQQAENEFTSECKNYGF